MFGSCASVSGNLCDTCRSKAINGAVDARSEDPTAFFANLFRKENGRNGEITAVTARELMGVQRPFLQVDVSVYIDGERCECFFCSMQVGLILFVQSFEGHRHGSGWNIYVRGNSSRGDVSRAA